MIMNVFSITLKLILSENIKNKYISFYSGFCHAKKWHVNRPQLRNKENIF